MKRRRNNRLPAFHTCPYGGCAKRFRSARLLTRHTSVHTAAQPLSCPHPGCTRTFALASDRDAHAREAHSKPAEASKPGMHVFDGDDECHAQGEGPDAQLEVDHGDVPRDTQVEDEADEIASNAAYLASQMKVARSYEIAQWHDEDYRNAHQWARWVQESVEDFPDIPYLEHKIKEKGLSMAALRYAERAFFDSVLAYEGFSQEILNYLLTAALMIDGKEREADDSEARVECLSAAITDAVERKNRLRVTADLTGQLQEVAGLELTDETLVAKAEILLLRHKEWDLERVREHVAGLDVADVGVFELVCHEAVMGHDARVTFRNILFNACRRGIRSGAVKAAGADLLAEVCERDVSFFDAYFSWLLGQLAHDADETQATQQKHENVDGLKGRIKSLAQRKGPIGHVTRCAMEDFSKRTGMKGLVTW